MEMSWDRLADRCQLFVDANKGMLIELLKEAEEELARECQILESSEVWSAPFPSTDGYGALGDSFDTGYMCLLPEDYGQMMTVFYNGNRLSPMDEYDQQRDVENLNRTGTPSRYYIITQLLEALEQITRQRLQVDTKGKDS